MHSISRHLLSLSAQLMGYLAHLAANWRARFRPGLAQRGDVPGWVLVTVMTAGLVAALYSIADDQLREMLTSALNKVS